MGRGKEGGGIGLESGWGVDENAGESGFASGELHESSGAGGLGGVVPGGDDRESHLQGGVVLLVTEFAGEEGVEMAFGRLEDGVVAASGDDAQGMDGLAGVDGKVGAGDELGVHEAGK